MRLGVVIACAFAWTGCYRPGAESSCTVRCNAEAQCPNGLTCELGLCRDMAGASCQSDAGNGDPDAYLDAPADSSPLLDASTIDAQPGCFGNDLYTYCPGVQLLDEFTVSSVMVIDTLTSSMCAQAVTQYCVVAHGSITLSGGGITARGSRPLVLVAATRIAVNSGAQLDVSSYPGAQRGAGAGTGACGNPTNGVTVNGSSGGGAGGTFSGRGGFGGLGGGAAGGQPAPVSTNPLTVRGGCPGTIGGGPTGGERGIGGGAVVLIAGNVIEISGIVLARGEGGAFGSRVSGGGGGGSGGLIALDAPMISITGAMVAAGGGGGGGGSSDNPGGNGGPASSVGVPGPGGSGGPGAAPADPEGGAGGSGSGPGVLRNGFGGVSITETGVGGGGGGGAAGVNRIRGTLTSTTTLIVPPAT